MEYLGIVELESITLTFFLMKDMEENLCGKVKVWLTKDKDTAIPRCSFSVDTLVTVSAYSCVDPSHA